jgi:hypothetical protein
MLRAARGKPAAGMPVLADLLTAPGRLFPRWLVTKFGTTTEAPSAIAATAAPASSGIVSRRRSGRSLAG